MKLIKKAKTMILSLFKTSPRTSTIVQFIFYFGPLRSARIPGYSEKSEINDWFRLIF